MTSHSLDGSYAWMLIFVYNEAMAEKLKLYWGEPEWKANISSLLLRYGGKDEMSTHIFQALNSLDSEHDEEFPQYMNQMVKWVN